MRYAAFLVLLIACGKPAKEPAPPVAPPPAPDTNAASEMAKPAPDPAAAGKKKRTRTAKAVPTTHDGRKPKNGRALNPKDPSGRTVFVREDDHCFIEIPDGTEVIDCPAGADDPAYDHCTAQIVHDAVAEACFCVSGAGNPRPMPRPTPCPTKK